MAGSACAALSSGFKWLRDDSFPEVPKELYGGDWIEVAKGPWRREESITLLEARACLRCLQQALTAGDAAGLHVLFLGDNLGCVLAVDRARAGTYELLVVIRKLAAICIQHEVRLHIRWIPSERNASDKASRFYDPELEVREDTDTDNLDTDFLDNNDNLFFRLF